MEFNTILVLAHQNAVNKGFWRNRNIDDIHSCLAEMALIHSEVSEATEALRKNDQQNFEEELADICIRVCDSAAARNIDLQSAIIKKMKINESREFMHGKKA